MKPAIQRAREMRKSMTPPEARLWVCLRKLRAEGFHFRRQAPFRGYFLDFVCNSRRLVVEVDGQTHEATVEHDRVRDAVLLREGFRTVRFSNAAVRDSIDWVMERIRAELAVSAPHPGAASPRRPSHKGEGESG